MYTRPHFSLKSFAESAEFVLERSFGVVATYHDGNVYTSPLPIDLRGATESEAFIAGHVARGNEMVSAFEHCAPATVTVLGADTYVPAEWFGARSRIPTWMYESVEITGTLELSDAARTRADVESMIDRLQQTTCPGSTWRLDEIKPERVDQHLKGIVGFRIIDLQFKSCLRLNQGQDHSENLSECLANSDVPARRRLAGLVNKPPTTRGGR